MTMIRKLRSCLLLVTLTGSLLTGVMARPAGAAAADMTCVTRQRATYSPGVMLEPSLQTVKVTTISNPCYSSSRPDITFGRATIDLVGMRSCLNIGQTGAGTSKVRWNTGEVTRYAYTSATETIAGQTVVVITGVVTGGLFKGDTIVIVNSAAAINPLNCLIPPGITSTTGVGTLVISSTP